MDEYANLDIICNARCDSVIYGLAPQPTGRRGRHGRRLSTESDFALSDERIGDYYIGMCKVLTNLFGQREVLAQVGQPARFARTISESDVYGFAGPVGDFNSARLNQVEAEKGIFGGRVAYGMLVRKR